MEGLKALQFAGENSDYCLKLGEPHLSVRFGPYYPDGMINAGDRIIVRDLEHSTYAVAWVTGVVHDVSFDKFDGSPQLLALERPGLRDADALKAALLSFYPEAGPESSWTFITYRPFMKEVTDGVHSG